MSKLLTWLMVVSFTGSVVFGGIDILPSKVGNSVMMWLLGVLAVLFLYMGIYAQWLEKGPWQGE